jgi:hypothetical protein
MVSGELLVQSDVSTEQQSVRYLYPLLPMCIRCSIEHGRICRSFRSSKTATGWEAEQFLRSVSGTEN